ncbi:MAG: hypothetical protein WBP64_06355 [Nitrososphaeraceae archaeon]
MKDMKDKQKDERTSITINKSVKQRLDKVGRMNQSYGELIGELLDFYIEHKGASK